MDDATARILFDAAVASSDDPTISDVEADVILQQHATSGVWTRRGLRKAIAEGCRLKAAKAAGTFDFATDGQSFERSQVVDHWLRIAETYDGGAVGTIRAAGRWTTPTAC